MELGLLHIIWLLWIWVNDCTVLGLISDIWNVGTSQSLIRCCHMPRAAVEAGGRGLSAACSANFDESIIVCSLASFFSGLASCLQFSADELDSWYSHLGLSACLWQAPVCTNCFFFYLPLLCCLRALLCLRLFVLLRNLLSPRREMAREEGATGHCWSFLRPAIQHRRTWHTLSCHNFCALSKISVVGSDAANHAIFTVISWRGEKGDWKAYFGSFAPETFQGNLKEEWKDKSSLMLLFSCSPPRPRQARLCQFLSSLICTGVLFLSGTQHTSDNPWIHFLGSAKVVHVCLIIFVSISLHVSSHYWWCPVM